MEFFRNFFTPKKVSKPGAGCIFTDGNLILAGYQPKGPYISGIGGSSFDGEEPIVTAMREVMEELLGISVHNTVLIYLIKLKYKKQIVNNNYTIFVYDFKDLENMLYTLNNFKYKSPLYKVFPKNIEELVFGRIEANVEISHLCILPLKSDLKIDKHFISDLALLK